MNCELFLLSLITLVEIDEILKNSRDPNELKYYWTTWHDGINRNIKASQYAEFIELKNLESISLGNSGFQLQFQQ